MSVGNEIITNYDMEKEQKYLNVITVGQLKKLDAQKELPEGSLAAEGQQVYLNAGCTQCHVINGVWDVQGDRIAPNLTHFANRNVLAGASLDNNKENLTKWLANPPEVKPGTFMPNLELSEKEIEALIAYLGTLK